MAYKTSESSSLASIITWYADYVNSKTIACFVFVSMLSPSVSLPLSLCHPHNLEPEGQFDIVQCTFKSNSTYPDSVYLIYMFNFS